MVSIAPSMLGADFGEMRKAAEMVASHSSYLHMDVMDGHFVPNLTYGPVVVAGLRQLTSLPLDAHLMISQPADFLDEYLDAGCDGITVHLEAFGEDTASLSDTLERIRAADAPIAERSAAGSGAEE